VLGVDDVVMAVQHTFTTSSKLGHMTGSSTYMKSSDEKKSIYTCLRNNATDPECTAVGGILESNFEKCCVKLFEPGETMKFSVREWASFADVTLDGRLKGQVEPGKDGKYPFHRLAGIKLSILMKYYGESTDDEILCVVEVQHTDGWTSFGSSMTYLDYNPLGSAEYYEGYQRGVRFSFYPQGSLTIFNYQMFFMQFLAGLVILGYVDTIVGFVATKLHPKRKTFAKAKTETLHYGQALAKFGINAALACTAFRQWDSHSTGGTPTITEDELVKVYTEKGCLPDATAKELAKAVMAAVDGKSGEIDCNDLVKLISTGLVSLESLPSAQQSQSSKVAPDDPPPPGDEPPTIA